MKTYKLDVEELHVVDKTYWIDAPSKVEAARRAHDADWDDATGDEPTGDISRVVIKRITKTTKIQTRRKEIE